MKAQQSVELFPTLVQMFDISDNIDIPVLLKLCKTTNIENHKLLENGKSSFNTNLSLLHNNKLANLKKEIQNCINIYCKTCGVPEDEMYITNSWFNILKKNGSVLPHTHMGSFISGAFYPSVKEGAGSIFFKNPLWNEQQHFQFAFTNVTSCTTEKIGIKPQSGMLVLFPSWLEHWTDINLAEERITISFNTHSNKQIKKLHSLI